MNGFDYDNYGAIDLSRHDTTPGAKSPFAPPAGWEGDETAYRNLMRRRYRQDPGCGQHISVTVWLYKNNPMGSVEITGPYRRAALRVIQALARPPQPRPAQKTSEPALFALV